ncbi:hypothetical protein PAMA_014991 [Pampus argenteus]
METLFLLLFMTAIQAKVPSWTINVPSSVKGLPGSCVVIPCSYDYPDPGKNVTQFKGIWRYKTGNNIYHPVASQIMQQYQNRTEQLGDVTQKNCSLKIDPLQKSDQTPFHFRIEIASYDAYSFLQNEVSISMINELQPPNFSLNEEVKEGVNVSASCSVSHSCPVSPPVFTWSHSGQEHLQPQQLDDGQWKATSTLTFQATKADNNQPLQCTVTYKGGQQQSTSKYLRVVYAPKIRNISFCSSSEDMIKCTCFVESSPSSVVHFLLSDRVLLNTTVEIHDSLTIGTLQAKLGSFGFIQCMANNTVGTAIITLTLSDKSKMQTLAIAIGTVGILVILIMVGVIKSCRGRSGDNPPSHTLAMTQHQTMEGLQHTTRPRKGTCVDDHIYGNMEKWATDNDVIYANT